MILGRPTLVNLQAITSILHLKMKFPTFGGTCEIKGDREASRFCYGSTQTLAQSDPHNMKKAHRTQKKMEKRRRHLEHQKNQKKRRREVQMVEMASEQLMEEFEPRMDANLKNAYKERKNPSSSPLMKPRRLS